MDARDPDMSAPLLGALHRKADLLTALLGEKRAESEALRRLDSEALETGRRAQQALLDALQAARRDATGELRRLFEAQGLSADDPVVSDAAQFLSDLESRAVRQASDRVRELARRVRELSERNAMAAHSGRRTLREMRDLRLGYRRPETGPLYSASGRPRPRHAALASRTSTNSTIVLGV